MAIEVPYQEKGVGSCWISESSNCLWFGIYILQTVIVDSSLMDIDTTSNEDFTGISVLGYVERASIATPPLARLQIVLLDFFNFLLRVNLSFKLVFLKA